MSIQNANQSKSLPKTLADVLGIDFRRLTTLQVSCRNGHPTKIFTERTILRAGEGVAGCLEVEEWYAQDLSIMEVLAKTLNIDTNGLIELEVCCKFNDRTKIRIKRVIISPDNQWEALSHFNDQVISESVECIHAKHDLFESSINLS